MEHRKKWLQFIVRMLRDCSASGANKWRLCHKAQKGVVCVKASAWLWQWHPGNACSSYSYRLQNFVTLDNDHWQRHYSLYLKKFNSYLEVFYLSYTQFKPVLIILHTSKIFPFSTTSKKKSHRGVKYVIIISKTPHKTAKKGNVNCSLLLCGTVD